MIMLGNREYYKWFAIIPGFIVCRQIKSEIL